MTIPKLPLEGVMPALCTPFTPDGADIDEAALRALVDQQIDAGGGRPGARRSTGEFTSL